MLVVAAFAVGAYILMGQPAGEEEQDPWAGREPAYIEDFSENVASSAQIYIVMDLRGTTEGRERTNIMQCGVDLASSTAIGGIPKSFYSMDSECITTLDDGTTLTVPLRQCLDEIDAARDAPGKAIFYIRKANETLIFENELVVGMGSEYGEMGCSINAEVTSSPAADAGMAQGLANYTSMPGDGGEIPEEAPADSTQ